MSDLEKLRATVEAFCRFTEGLPEEALVEQEWGPREVLSHLVFWHESYVAQAEALLPGEPFEPPQGRFSDLNARAVAANREVPVSELVCRFRATDERLCSLYEAHDPTGIVLEIKQGAKPRSLAALLPEVEAQCATTSGKRSGGRGAGGSSRRLQPHLRDPGAGRPPAGTPENTPAHPLTVYQRMAYGVAG